MIDSYYVCQPGRVRTVNQDRAGCFTSGDQCLGFVADGMGGHYGGEQASEIVARACSQWWDSLINAAQRPDFPQSVEQLRHLLSQCHGKIAEITPPNTTCGTTAVLLWISGKEYALFSVGDSRCYKTTYRLGFAQRPVQLTHDDVSREPYLAGKLTRALGAGACAFSLKTGQVRRGTMFALCSDGIYKACPSLRRELRRLSAKIPLEKAADRITAQVNEYGAPDNYALVLLRV